MHLMSSYVTVLHYILNMSNYYINLSWKVHECDLCPNQCPRGPGSPLACGRGTPQGLAGIISSPIMH